MARDKGDDARSNSNDTHFDPRVKTLATVPLEILPRVKDDLVKGLRLESKPSGRICGVGAGLYRAQIHTPPVRISRAVWQIGLQILHHGEQYPPLGQGLKHGRVVLPRTMLLHTDLDARRGPPGRRVKH
jgi:hypothetical protein